MTSSLISSADIFGIWFYDKDECARIGQLMNSLVQITLGSQKDLGSGKNKNILLNFVSGYHADTPITIKAEPSIWPTAAFINIHEHPI